MLYGFVCQHYHLSVHYPLSSHVTQQSLNQIPSQTRLKQVTETRLIGSFKNKVLFVEKTYV